jgi:lipopolysaccharide assembly protein A
MRWFYLTVVLLFVAATMIFASEHVEAVTMSFLGLSIRAPLALLAAVACFTKWWQRIRIGA